MWDPHHMVLSRLSCLPQEVVDFPPNFDISGRFWAPRDPPGGPPTPPENFGKIKKFLKKLKFSKKSLKIQSFLAKILNFLAPWAPGDPPGGPPTPLQILKKCRNFGNIQCFRTKLKVWDMFEFSCLTCASRRTRFLSGTCTRPAFEN